MVTDDFMTSFSTCFAVLGLKLLFGSKQVTIGTVVLLGAVSAAMASAWTGGGAAWLNQQLGSALNASMIDTAQSAVLRAACASAGPLSALSGVCPSEGREVEHDQL